LLEEISSSFSKAKLTESEAKTSIDDFNYFVSSRARLSKEKLKKSNFPEFLFVHEKMDDTLFGHKFYEDD